MFDQMTGFSPALILSSWLPPDGYDADAYAWDNFLLPYDSSINEVWWVGGGAPVTGFTVRFYTGLAGYPDYQPTITALPESETSADYLKGYRFSGTANETPIAGTSLNQYHVTLPTPLRLPGNTVYWIKIEGDVTGYPYWGLATATQGRDNQHFAFITGLHRFFSATGSEAFQLRGTRDAPTFFTISSGSLLSGNLASLYDSDDDWLSIFPDEVTLRTQVEVGGNSRLQVPSSLAFSFEGSVERSGLSQLLQLRNYSTGTFDTVDGRVATVADGTVEILVNSGAPNYVGPNGSVLARITWQPINDEDPSQDGWLHKIDVVQWTVN